MYVQYMTQVPYIYPQLDADFILHISAKIVLGFCGKYPKFLRKSSANAYHGIVRISITMRLNFTRTGLLQHASKQMENFRLFKKNSNHSHNTYSQK